MLGRDGGDGLIHDVLARAVITAGTQLCSQADQSATAILRTSFLQLKVGFVRWAENPMVLAPNGYGVLTVGSCFVCEVFAGREVALIAKLGFGRIIHDVEREKLAFAYLGSYFVIKWIRILI